MRSCTGLFSGKRSTARGAERDAASTLERVPVHLCKGWPTDASRRFEPVGSPPEPLSLSSVSNLDDRRCRRLAPFAVGSRSREAEHPSRREAVPGQHLQPKAVYPDALL